MTSQIEDLDFLGDITLISTTIAQMLRKAGKMSGKASRISLKIKKKTEVLKNNVKDKEHDSKIKFQTWLRRLTSAQG